MALVYQPIMGHTGATPGSKSEKKGSLDGYNSTCTEATTERTYCLATAAQFSRVCAS